MMGFEQQDLRKVAIPRGKKGERLEKARKNQQRKGSIPYEKRKSFTGFLQPHSTERRAPTIHRGRLLPCIKKSNFSYKKEMDGRK